MYRKLRQTYRKLHHLLRMLIFRYYVVGVERYKLETPYFTFYTVASGGLTPCIYGPFTKKKAWKRLAEAPGLPEFKEVVQLEVVHRKWLPTWWGRYDNFK